MELNERGLSAVVMLAIQRVLYQEPGAASTNGACFEKCRSCNLSRIVTDNLSGRNVEQNQLSD